MLWPNFPQSLNASLRVASRHPEAGSVCYCDLSRCGFVRLDQMGDSSGPRRTGPGCWTSVLALVLLTGWFGPARAVSEPGKWLLNVDSETLKTQSYFLFRKTLFNNTLILLNMVSMGCNSSSAVNLTMSWYLRNSHCYNEVFQLEAEKMDVLQKYSESTEEKVEEGRGFYVKHQYDPFNCQTHTFGGLGTFSTPIRLRPKTVTGTTRTTRTAPPVRRRDTVASQPHFHAVAQSWEDGPYMFILHIDTSAPNAEPWSLQMEISMKGPHDYVSVSDWPLMMFSMAMCVVYVLMAVLWLVLSACYWTDLLRIQFWIGGIIFLGMVEAAVSYADFQSVRYEGRSVPGAVLSAAVVSSVKKTLARVLVIIASLGYGIVKPRLGALLHRVVGVGLLYLIFSLIYGILSVTSDPKGLNSIMSSIAVAFIDSCIAWWMFMSLGQTLKLLRLRRNVVKLSLYRHFTNTLIFAVIVSVIFMLWSDKTFRKSTCGSDWRDLWLNDAFWSFLFAFILLVIMFLWRPSANNQRYAFSPLVDEESEDEEKEPMMNEAFEGMKLRGVRNDSNGAATANQVDEDLQWVEENIPSSMADVVLPPLLDSDEEIKTTKFEMSKMD